MYLPIIAWDDIRNLPVPDLALRLLTALTKSNETDANRVFRGLDAALRDDPQPDRDQLLARLSDCWAWLESHALIGPSIENSSRGSQRVTSTGRELAGDPDAIVKVWADKRLSGDLATQLLPARSNFALGDYETASFAAMKAVEVEVRTVSGLPNELVGVPLMRKAFNPVGGPLSDQDAERGEQQATADLFAGAMGAFKNPASHRTVRMDDAVEAAEIVQLADLLLRIVRRASARVARSAV